MAGLLFAADAATKTWAEHELRRGGARSHLDGHLVLRYQTNSGIAFGLFQPHLHPRKRAWLITYSGVVTAGVGLLLGARTLWPRWRAARLTQAGLVLLLAGSAGNLRDRVVRGAVIDFIDVEPWPGAGWPTFNLADAYLAIGIALCLWQLLRRRTVS